jgi:hypothetical protein
LRAATKGWYSAAGIRSHSRTVGDLRVPSTSSESLGRCDEDGAAVSKFGDPFSTHLPGGRPDLYRHGWFTGPRQTAVVNRPLGHTRAVGAVFRTGGAAAVVGVPANVTTGTAIAIDDVLGADAARLRDDLDAAPAWQEELDRFEAFLRARLDPELGRLRRVERAVSELVAPARPSITGLAADLGITVQHLGREFRYWVGLSP